MNKDNWPDNWPFPTISARSDNMNQTDSGWRKRQIALDKKAENARELGLDYEPVKTARSIEAKLREKNGAIMDREEIIKLARKVGYPLVEYEGTPYIPPLLAALLKAAATPQRPWVGLTDEEISDIAINNPPMVHEFARAIEAAHGIKETTK
jgi:hypothetical protein